MRVLVSAGLSVVMVAGGVVATPRAAVAAPYRPPTAQQDWVTPSRIVPPTAGAQPRVAAPGPATPVWPRAGEHEVSLPAVRGLRGEVATARIAVAGTPVAVAARDQAAPVARARVRVYDGTATRTAGVRGVLVGVRRADGVAGTGAVDVTLSYGGFVAAFGADWSSRLRLVKLPECALRTPDRAECRGVPLNTANDTKAATLTASVTVNGAETLLAAEAGASGGAGDYGATSLQPSATWTAASSTGEFVWSYPMRTPPGVGGLAPKLELAYSSGSVDGRMAASNNQPSWAGEGFELWPGFIERRYMSCADDRGSGANNTSATGDLCWATDNAVVSLAGHAGELIKDAGTPERWHLRGDDGSYVQHRTGAGNGDDNGEWWVVSTTDGTQYWFGGRGNSGATWTVPVAGNHSGEPCRQASFANSFCTQAWRWNLDHVVDPHGNTLSYDYSKETNAYAKVGDTSAPATYDRGGFLTRVSYGTRTGSTATAPAVVDVAVADRCVTANCATHNGVNWPDTPWDLQCTGSPCHVVSPSFWTTKRLAGITTKLWTGTAYSPVTTYTFTHSFPSPGDGTRAGLVLDRISQTGQVRVTTAMPDVVFAYVQLNNRVDPHLTSDHSPAMNWFRLAHVTSETGGRIEVTYSPEDCVAGSRMPDPNALHANTLRCYPVRWTPPGFLTPIVDYFHKYVVTEVHEVDTVTPGNPTVVHSYEFVGDPAWHYSDDDGLIKAADKTWSVWRGYGTVRVRDGMPGGSQTLTETRYFRGMHGDKLPQGTRTATVAAVDMNKDGDTGDAVDVPAINDEDAFAGAVREKIIYNGSDEVSAEVRVPYQSEPTASRTVNGFTVHARHMGTKETHTRLIRDGGRAPRTTSAVTAFDSFGMPVEVDDRGDESVATDDTCTLTDYVRNTSVDRWLAAAVKRKRQFAVGCTRAKQPGLTSDQVVADEKTYHDLATDLDTPPTRGLVTRVEILLDWVDGAPVHMQKSTSRYDEYGRPTVSTDAKGNETVTAYTHNAAGHLTRIQMTNSLGWQTSRDIEPAFGEPLSETDPNNRITSVERDGLGRLTALWRPGRDKGVQSANEIYTYLVRNNAPTVVSTGTLLPSGGYLTTYELFDGLLRARQTQAPRGDGGAGAIVTDTFYDAAGRIFKTYSPYLIATAPGPLLAEPNEQGEVSQRFESLFDGAGRPVAQIRLVRDPVTGVVAEHSRRSTGYGGDRVDQTPPAGGTATSSFTDADGNTTARWTYRGPVPTPFVAGSYEATTYEYTGKGQLARVTDAAGNQWTTTYDVRGQVETTTDPDAGTHHLRYNSYGELESKTDPRGVTLVYTYDSLARRTGLYQGSVAPANRLATWEYDGLTNSRGQLTKSTRWVGTNGYVREILGFTAQYQPTGVKFTVPASETGLAGSYSYFYTYRSDGSAETAQQPDVDGTGGLTSEILRTEYTTTGRVSQLKTSIGNTTIVSATSYTGYGELATVTLQSNAGATVSLARTYADGTRLLVRSLTSRQTAPTSVADLRYTYDKAGNIVGISDVVSNDNQCFAYDHLLRLTQAWTPAGGDCAAQPSVAALGGPAPYWTSWEFDTSGNRREQVEHVTPAGVRTTTYDHADGPHQLSSATVQDATGTDTLNWGYTAEGGYLTSRPNGAGQQSITWDPEGHVATVDGTTSYVYDADGNRMIRRDPTGKTLYLPGQELRHTTSGGTKKATRYYSHAGVMVAMRTTGGITWLSGDHQGTVAVSIVATTQAVAVRRQDPFGNARGGSGTWPVTMDKGFVGGTLDNTGLTHLGAREYDPVVGRFISPDPLIDFNNPRHLDGYAYAFQNPICYADPSGESPTLPKGQEYVTVAWFSTDVVVGEYKYTIRFELYAICRNNRTECLVRYNTNGLGFELWWEPWRIKMAAANGADVQLKIFVGVSITFVKNRFMGPQVPRTLVDTRPANRAHAMRVSNPPPPRCQLWDFTCMVNDWEEWWANNSPWVEGATIVAETVCIFVTAGACGVVGVVDMASTVLDHAAEHEMNGGGDWSASELAALGADITWNIAVDRAVDTATGPHARDGGRGGANRGERLGITAAGHVFTSDGFPLGNPAMWTFLD